jgi:hypothetical protein
MPAPFDLNSSPIEDICQQLAMIYEHVDLSEDPMFRWVQIVNDTTLLGEEVRRDRKKEAIKRTGKILMRLLEFIGYYLYVYQAADDAFPDLLANTLREPSYKEYFGDGGPKEGITRWVLAKYPRVCAKCAQSPCTCLLTPWVFEERRENPGPFHTYSESARNIRLGLNGKDIPLFTLPGLFDFFAELYRNSYYREEPWRIAMHAAEELGEATSELSRIELAHKARGASLSSKKLIKDITDVVHSKIHDETARVRSKADRERLAHDARGIATKLLKELSSGMPAWEMLRRKAGEHFKEEVSDVFSWLAAIVHKLTNGRVERALLETAKRYVASAGAGPHLKCPWCGEQTCADTCVITHGVAREIIEEALKF